MKGHFLTIALSALTLTACPPGASHVCTKLESLRAPDYAPPTQEHCMEKLDAMRSKSSGEYGMCSECIMNARDRAGVAACREQCPGFEDALPKK